jgi:diaminohydroxyphosphoribosylaminopyrimidine deaminase / 5-amino-6-(5-phosphoribosylamino)uracil reductase
MPTTFTERDAEFMRRALDLARGGAGFTSPNPLVGAVLVRENEVVGAGYHQRYGGPHAEVHALDAAGDRARGATLYVTLEPCCVSGRTPPCTDALIRAGVARVILPVNDPNPAVSGRGVEQLRDAGIEVDRGLLEAEAVRLNAPYFRYRQKGLPLVTLKLAMSIDGRVRPPAGGPRWTSSEASRRHVHEMRSTTDCVMVGAGTMVTDDPRLTDRRNDRPARQPDRLVVDTHLRTPANASMLGESMGRTIFVCGETASRQRRSAMEGNGALVWSVPERAGRVDLRAAMQRCAESGMLSVLAEGGPTVATSLINEGLVDRVAFFVAPRLYGAGGLPAFAELGPAGGSTNGQLRFENASWRQIGGDYLFEADLVREERTKAES